MVYLKGIFEVKMPLSFNLFIAIFPSFLLMSFLLKITLLNIAVKSSGNNCL